MNDAMTMHQPIYTDCTNCGSCNHRGYECPCACHARKEEALLTPAEVDAHVAARRASACPYPVILVFVREFTAGTLKGRKHIDTLPFCTEADAVSWVCGINAKAAKGRMSYRVVADHMVKTAVCGSPRRG